MTKLDLAIASGLLVLPGGIDSHVHIAQPSGPDVVMADDFASATVAAAAGGNTCIMAEQQEMPALWCAYMDLPPSSSYADDAAVLMNAIWDQTSLTMGVDAEVAPPTYRACSLHLHGGQIVRQDVPRIIR